MEVGLLSPPAAPWMDLSIQSLSLPSIPNSSLFLLSLKLSQSLSLFFFSLSSLIPHYRLMKISELVENSRLCAFCHVVIHRQIHSLCIHPNWVKLSQHYCSMRLCRELGKASKITTYIHGRFPIHSIFDMMKTNFSMRKFLSELYVMVVFNGFAGLSNKKLPFIH